MGSEMCIRDRRTRSCSDPNYESLFSAFARMREVTGREAGQDHTAVRRDLGIDRQINGFALDARFLDLAPRDDDFGARSECAWGIALAERADT